MRLRDNLDREVGNQVALRSWKRRKEHVVESTGDPHVFRVKINKKVIKSFKPGLIKGLRVLETGQQGQQALFTVNYDPKNGRRKNGGRSCEESV